MAASAAPSWAGAALAKCLVFTLLAMASAFGSSAPHSWPDLTIQQIGEDFWRKDMAARMPRREFVEAVTARAITVTDAQGGVRRIAFLSIASEFSFQGTNETAAGGIKNPGLWPLFLTNLQNITFSRRGGEPDHLARHLVATVMTLPGASADRCNALSEPFGAKCVVTPSPIFSADNYHYKSPPFYGLSFAKILTILDALSLGLDVFFLDGDQVFFRNPLPYFLARDIDVLVSGDCMARSDTVPQERFPPINSNIGVLYLRARPAVARAVMGWAAHLAWRAAEGQPTLDQSTFNGAMEWISKDMGAKVMSVAMLLAENFPHWCMGPCGCNTTGTPWMALGHTPHRQPDGTCHVALMRRWYNYHVPCDGDMNQKARTLLELLDMYERRVGPVNSLSDPMDAL